MNSIPDQSAVILLRITALLALGWAAHWLLRQRHARWRLILWRSLLGLGLALPLTAFFPVAVIHLPIYKVPAPVSSLPIIAAKAPFHQSNIGLQRATVQPQASVLKPSAATPLPQKSFPWKTLLLAVWGVGAGGAAIRLGRLQMQLRQRVAGSLPANQEWQERAREIQARLGVVSTIELRVSDVINSPFACGLWRPVILLPQKLILDLPEDEISALLAHEMAHFRQNDLFWCLACRLALAAFWFHPLVWRISSAHGLACEQGADCIASGDAREPGDYPRLLARLAMRVHALPDVETQLVLNGASRIAQRLRHLQNGGTGDWNWQRSAAGYSLAGALFVLARMWGFSIASPAAAQSDSSSSHFITIRAFIDGADMVRIQGNKVWYEHESWELPGRWQGRDENTMINGAPWHPVWHFYVGRSKPYEELQPVFAPISPEGIKLKQLSGSGTVKITELPGAENHQTLSFRIDNRPAIGADSYEVNIEWNKGAVANVIRIKASIFGAVTVRIQGNKMWYEQESWQWEDLTHFGQHDETTVINDKPWHPEWLIADEGSTRLGGNGGQTGSDPYLGLQPAFAPKKPGSIKLTKIAGRGEVEIRELPTPENHETLSVHLDDSPVDGADWYEVKIEWQ